VSVATAVSSTSSTEGMVRVPLAVESVDSETCSGISVVTSPASWARPVHAPESGSAVVN